MYIRRLFILLSLLVGGWFSAGAISLSLDSIAEWGRFPRFCIDVYRWGDGFFNGYDTTYVVGAGYKFNTKVRADSWRDSYNFYLPEGVRMQMHSEPSTTMGLWLTYLAVSAGYDKNVSKFFGGPESNRKEQFTFGFNCSLFAFNMYFVNNTNPTKISRFGTPQEHIRPDIEFDGMAMKSFGFDACYFFNHKRYSQAAAFSYSRIQVKSQGSWFAGFSYSIQNYDFNFNSLPEYMRSALPESWVDNRYKANTKTWALKAGYGYNWVFAPKWLLGVSESPALGINTGTINDPNRRSTNASFANQLKLSLVWNHRHWFAGMTGVYDTTLFYDKESLFQNSSISGSILVGYRFNIW